MKKRILFVLALFLLVFAGPITAQDEETGVRVITLFTTEADPPQLQALNAIVDEYNAENPEVFIDVVTGTPATRGQRTATLVASGLDAGIFELEPSFAFDWAASDLLLPLDDIVEENGGRDNYVPGTLFTYNDTVYGLPYATSVYGLYYRTDLFEEAGIEPPTNYDELLAAAAALTDTDAGVYGITMPGTTNSAVSFFSMNLWQNCLDYYTPAGELVFDDPAALEALERWVALSEFAPPGFEGWSWGDQITAFVTGQAAMSIYAGRLGVRMSDQAPQLEGITDLTRIPLSVTEGAPYVTYGATSRFAISANSEYPETAKDFLQFFLSGEQHAQYNATVLGHMVPPLIPVAERLQTWESDYAANNSDWLQFFDESSQFVNHQSNNMGSVVGCEFNRVDYVVPWGGSIFSSGGVIDNMLQQIFVGGTEPEEAWNEAIEEMTRIQEEWLADNPDWVSPFAE